ncbi:MAG TPA: metalloregulator ArsR/SmtB family transcription factor [Pyrinomonadaceae bacterium]|nr:metalloregulator ArsR/SmtB family transcription factor [Pyrinomonadaceae bacterium]
MTNKNDVALCSLFLALSDPTRLKLLRLMADGERSVGYLAEKLGESQPKVSRHLAFLRDHDVVSARRDGKHIYYHINVATPEACSVLSVITGESGTPAQQQTSTEQTPYIRRAVYDKIEDEMPIYLL